jgi:uncharacterized membrane protein
MTSRLIALPPLFAAEPNVGLWSNPIDGLIASVATMIMAIGVVIVIWGAYCSVIRLIALETATVRLRLPSTDTAPVRLLFTAYLLSGLDFLIAGAVIKTLAESDWQQLTVLGSIVLVRTLLGAGMKWQASPASVEMSPPLLEFPTAAHNGALAGKHSPEPATPEPEKSARDPSPVAGHAAP